MNTDGQRPEAPWPLVLLLLLLLGQSLATLRNDNRCWPFHPVKVYTQAERFSEAPWIVLFQGSEEVGLVEGGVCRAGLGRKLGRRIYHARPRSTQQAMLDDLLDFFEDRRGDFEGLRLYRLTFDLSRQKLLQRELLLESRWR